MGEHRICGVRACRHWRCEPAPCTGGDRRADHLGYPAYLATILGVWKLLGSTAILSPGHPRLKEWAYAGMFFTLTGAALSHTVSGDPVANILVPLVLLGFVMTSWALQSARQAVIASDATARQIA